MPIIGEYVTAENIKDLLKVGDEVIIDDHGRFTVTYTYWNGEGESAFCGYCNNPDDLGFETDAESNLYNLICHDDMIEGTHVIEKMTKDSLSK